MTGAAVHRARKRIKVLVIDDSALMRKILTEMLGSDPDIEVVGTAANPLVAREMIRNLNPDVLTLDIEMPKLDGLAFLERLMRLRPMPVVMVSSLTQKDADITLQALEMGAVDFIAKPALDIAQGFAAMQEEMAAKVKTAARAIVHGRHAAPPRAPRAGSAFRGSNRIVAIGASTGGVAALREVLAALPADAPPILIAQHMPPGFTKLFAKRLDGLCAMRVSEAADTAMIIPGHVYIAPGDRHLAISRSGGFYQCRLSAAPLVNGHMPSVDVLFDSCAAEAGADAVGLLLTGMGRDGAEGLRRMRAAGAATACQDEATSLIYGMPKAAMAIGAAEREISLDSIAAYILQQARAGQRPKDVKAS
jgi:two-component system, chemotaxis family, protein-glutamate methylesterase/glutaminase